MAYGNFKDLPRKTASDQVLHDQAFNIAKNLYKFFDKVFWWCCCTCMLRDLS